MGWPDGQTWAWHLASWGSTSLQDQMCMSSGFRDHFLSAMRELLPGEGSCKDRRNM